MIKNETSENLEGIKKLIETTNIHPDDNERSLELDIGESIMIGNHVKIRVLGIERGRIKIGIKAPREFWVYREETYKKIRKGKDGFFPMIQTLIENGVKVFSDNELADIYSNKKIKEKDDKNNE